MVFGVFGKIRKQNCNFIKIITETKFLHLLKYYLFFRDFYNKLNVPDDNIKTGISSMMSGANRALSCFQNEARSVTRKVYAGLLGKAEKNLKELNLKLRRASKADRDGIILAIRREKEAIRSLRAGI